MKTLTALSLFLCVALLFVGCAKHVGTSTPPPPSPVQFVAYAEATVTAAETALALTGGLSQQDQQLAQTALADLGQGIMCVYSEAISQDSTVLKIQNITACLSGLTVPPQASPQLKNILAGAFATIKAFTQAYLAQTQAQQAATVAAITPAVAQPVAQRAAALVH